MAKTIIGVMGPGASPAPKDLEDAFEIGKLIAQQNWVLLTGGRKAGVMDAASKGAKEFGGLTIGILPGSNKKGISDYVDIPIVTGMGSARNNINVLSCDVIVACGSGLGTASEIMLALKAKKPVILINQDESLLDFLNTNSTQKFYTCSSPLKVVEKINQLL
ncbi:MAG: TIGR00725 family protein [Balneolaceae bacterium]|nr:TIGR00725 family protein [Balneolaceae bacterium]